MWRGTDVWNRYLEKNEETCKLQERSGQKTQMYQFKTDK